MLTTEFIITTKVFRILRTHSGDEVASYKTWCLRSSMFNQPSMPDILILNHLYQLKSICSTNTLLLFSRKCHTERNGLKKQ